MVLTAAHCIDGAREQAGEFGFSFNDWHVHFVVGAMPSFIPCLDLLRAQPELRSIQPLKYSHPNYVRFSSSKLRRRLIRAE